MSDDLSVVAPEPIVVVVKGERIEVKQVKVGQLTKVMRIVHPFYDKLTKAKAEADRKQESFSVNLFQIVVEHTDPAIEIITVLTNKDRAWVEDMGIDELVALFGAVVEVNLDFFLQKVLPSLLKLTAGLSAPVTKEALLGQIPSKSSSDPATGTTTSSTTPTPNS